MPRGSDRCSAEWDDDLAAPDLFEPDIRPRPLAAWKERLRAPPVDQATDRSHRIGQTRAVFAYRLIARGTIEEKVLALQESKRALADALIAADEGALAAAISE
jgi:hypothetical protein